ncbi:MAG: hypothetical protein ACLSE6_04665 [Alphaproteobacteria bacterium]
MSLRMNGYNFLLARLIRGACIVAGMLLLNLSVAAAQEITAVDFNGDLIGYSDGKVVSFDNQLIGNVTADSF